MPSIRFVMEPRPAALALAMVCAGVSPAFGSFFTLVSDTRSVSAAVSVSNSATSASFGPEVRTPPGLGLDWTSNNTAQGVRTVLGAGASAGATQQSTFGADGVITVLGTASGSANTINGGLAAGAMSSSIVDLLIDVPPGTRVQVQASRSGSGVVRLSSEQGSQVFFNGSGFFDQTFAATRLRFFASATSIVSIGPETTGSDGGAFSVTLTIPAPCSMCTLAVLALSSQRRRTRPSLVPRNCTLSWRYAGS